MSLVLPVLSYPYDNFLSHTCKIPCVLPQNAQLRTWICCLKLAIVSYLQQYVLFRPITACYFPSYLPMCFCVDIPIVYCLYLATIIYLFCLVACLVVRVTKQYTLIRLFIRIRSSDYVFCTFVTLKTSFSFHVIPPILSYGYDTFAITNFTHEPTTGRNTPCVGVVTVNSCD